MASGRVSSLLDRFKYEQKPTKKFMSGTGSSAGVGDKGVLQKLSKGHSASLRGGSTQIDGDKQSRSSTPDSDEILCIPETPTSDLPESIESGSPVFPSAKKRIAGNSQRSLVSSTISSLLSPTGGGGGKSPTFGKKGHLMNGNGKQSGRPSYHGKNKQICIIDSDSESDNQEILSSRDSSLHSNTSHDIKSSSQHETDSTHLSNKETQDSLETVAYSYEDHSQESPRKRAGGLKRKLSEMSSGADEELEDDRLKRDAMEQLRICFPRKDNKELKRALQSTDWNINKAANDLMQEGSPPRRKICTSPPDTKKTSTVNISNGSTKKSYQDAFSGWLQKPTTSQTKKSLPLPKIVHRKVISSSSDDDDDAVVEVMPEKNKETKPKKTFQRIRTFSSDSMEDMSPVKKDNGMIGKHGAGTGDEDKSKDGPGKIATGFYKKESSSLQNGSSGKKPFRKVWSGFLPDDASKSTTSIKQKKSGKKTTKTTKAVKRPRSPKYSDSENDELQYDDSGSEYEGEEDVSPEFQAMAVSFFNDATVEELISIDGCSKGKAEKIVSIRPFEDFADLLERFDENKRLNSGLVWNCEEVFKERRVMEDLMSRCTKISERIQRKVTSVIENPDTAINGQLTRQPALLNRSMQLKPYQLVGLNWLKLMHTEGVNGILADEMGLGKTIQVIAFLAHLMEEGEMGPHLIVAPSSTLDNWMRELQTWCPALDCILYHGSQADRQEIREDLLYDNISCHVIVTSYNLCASTPEDRGVFKKLPVKYAIFDEGHMLKNMKSQRYHHLMKIKAEKRLLLTGTPLQNNLPELISLLAFTLPKLFGGKTNELTRVFCMKKQKTEKPHEQSGYEMERIAHAKRIMQPFVLRRIKIDVLSQLPKKVEQVHYVDMTKEQKKGYDQLVTSISEDIKAKGSSAGKMSCAMMELRKQANHPLLLRRLYDDSKLRKMAKLMLKEPTHYDANEEYIYEDMEVMSDFELHQLCHEYGILKEYRLDQDLVTQSGKFQLLDELLAKLKEEGSRVLLFSQFVIVLDIVQEYLKIRGHKFLRLDGQTPVSERVELIDKFNNDDSVFIFMLSTRAGGMGINLTAANTVILHDIDFNPYNDKQAEDRCHRVGQTREVSIIRLVSKQTIEEGMLSCANYKLKLEKQMTSGISGDEGNDETKDIASMLKNALDI